MMRSTQLQIAVTVDTEEEGLWGSDFPVSGNTTDNLRGLDRFQSVCEELGVIPTYLIDAPVLDDRVAMESMTAWQNAGRCEVGAHCHPWCNPPISQLKVSGYESFLHNLPEELQEQKLAWLTERIAAVVGRPPTSFRAGRYGFHTPMVASLARLGYRVDSSVLPLFDYSAEHGPDFTNANRLPHMLQHGEWSIVEVPVTSGFTHTGLQFRKWLWLSLRRKPWTYMRLAGIADRIGMARRVKLTPEGTQAADLQRLVTSVIGEGCSTLVLMLHSSSLLAGKSPYARTELELNLLYHRLQTAVEVATRQFGCKPVTLTEAGERAKPFITTT